ncbi:hypothetical protein AVEN_134633-1 [Araneus ventricosus]|uniref:Uncharacterized protein n=1 Tax=Araneus ventricosus TaxID=182803 RepID=A0A4Y2VT46_ARAVE|nr:hypothetical protein AVEN_134633-1 [Araneus ventricosus]
MTTAAIARTLKQPPATARPFPKEVLIITEGATRPPPLLNPQEKRAPAYLLNGFLSMYSWSPSPEEWYPACTHYQVTVQQRIPRLPLLDDFTPERGVRQ